MRGGGGGFICWPMDYKYNRKNDCGNECHSKNMELLALTFTPAVFKILINQNSANIGMVGRYKVVIISQRYLDSDSMNFKTFVYL